MCSPQQVTDQVLHPNKSR